MVEGEKLFDISVRWPKWRRSSETSILDIPVDIVNNQVVLTAGPGRRPVGDRLRRGGAVRRRARWPTPPTRSATRRGCGCATWSSPVGEDGAPDPSGQFERAGASDIYREQGKRMIAIKFSVRGRDLGGAVDEAREQTKDLFQAPYRAVWSGEFEEMEDAEGRLMIIIPLSLGLIFILLYSAFRSLPGRGGGAVATSSTWRWAASGRCC